MKIEGGKLSLPEPELAGKIPRYPAFVDAKLDGEYAVYYLETNAIYGKAKGNKKRLDFPACQLAKRYCEELHTEYLLGELIFGEGKAGDLYTLLSNKNNDNLKFAIFDYVQKDPHLILMERKSNIAEIIPCDFSLASFRVPTEYVTCREELINAYDNFIEQGFEGVVVKNVNGTTMTGRLDWVKMKAKETADLLVVNADPVKERVGVGIQNKELCGIKVPGTTRQEREDMIGKIVEVEYLQKLYKNKVLTGLRNPIFKRIRHDKDKISFQ